MSSEGSLDLTRAPQPDKATSLSCQTYIQLLQLVIGTNKHRFALLIMISILAALTEGVSVLMLVPVFEQSPTAYADNLVLGPIMDTLAPLEPTTRIVYVASALIVLLIVRGVLVFGAQALGGTLPLRVQWGLANQSYNLLLGARLEYLRKISIGDLTNYLLFFPTRTAKSARSIADLFSNAFLAAVYLFLMFVIVGSIAFAALIVAAILYLLMKKLTAARLAQAGRTVSVRQSELGSLFIDSYNGAELIRLTGAFNSFRDRHCQAFSKLIAAMRRNVLITVAYAPAMTTVSGILLCVGLIAGALISDEAGSFVSRMVLLMIAFYRILTPVTSMSVSHGALQGQMDSFVKLRTFLEEAEAAKQPDGESKLDSFRSAIEFEDVNFEYSGGSGPALRDVSLRIERGQTVALVGPSGAGKSTVTHLLTRLYDVSGGVVRIDGTPIEDIEIASWRHLTATVSQDVVLFNDTVLNNLTIGIVGVSRDEVRQALRDAAALDFVEALPNGLDTVLGERGNRLSGGQRQRLAIARTLLSRPEVLIFDEATSQLDTETEAAIQRLVENFGDRRTVIIVAHRLATVRRADKIIFIEDGRVVDEGSYEDMIESCQRFRMMVESQNLGSSVKQSGK